MVAVGEVVGVVEVDADGVGHLIVGDGDDAGGAFAVDRERFRDGHFVYYRVPQGGADGAARRRLLALLPDAEPEFARDLDKLRALRAGEDTGAFASLDDFAKRLDTKAVNKKILESLIRCGAFDFDGEDRARMIARIHHPHVGSVIDFGVEGGLTYMVMEYLHGTATMESHPDEYTTLRKVHEYEGWEVWSERW